MPPHPPGKTFVADNRFKKRYYQPHPYQATALRLMEEKGSLALLLDPGMGKTSICLEDFRRRYVDVLATRALVVAPLATCHNVWPQEQKKWFQFRDLKVTVLHGKGRTIENANTAQIAVINPAGLKWLLENHKEIDEWFDCLYVDESTTFKTASSKRSRALYKLSHKVRGGIPNRFILTGTPAPNGVADLFGQFGILDPSILGKTLGEFRSNFQFNGRRTHWGVEWEPGPESADLIYKKVAPHSLRLDAMDHLDLPSIVYTRRDMELDPKTQSLYLSFAKDMYAELDNGTLVGVNAGALSSKCRQLANGAVYLTELGEASSEETRKVEYVHKLKCKALCDLWDELGHKPMLIAYEFKHDLTMIKHFVKDKYGFEPRYIGGGVSPEEVSKTIEDWNAGDLPMLLVNPQSAAHGINLQSGGHHLCWYSLTWNLEHYQQLNGRLWRQGQREGVFVHHIIAKYTVDEVVWNCIASKNQTQRTLLAKLKEYRKAKGPKSPPK